MMSSDFAELLASTGIGPDLHVDLTGHVDLLDVKFNGHLLQPGHQFSKDQVSQQNALQSGVPYLLERNKKQGQLLHDKHPILA